MLKRISSIPGQVRIGVLRFLLGGVILFYGTYFVFTAPSSMFQFGVFIIVLATAYLIRGIADLLPAQQNRLASILRVAHWVILITSLTMSLFTALQTL
jgi:hypothetical protein